MEKKRKYNSLIKLLILCILQAYIFSFYAFLFFTSLSDAKVGEYGIKYLGGGDFAEDVGKMVEAFAQVLGYEVGGEARGEAVDDTRDCFYGVGERFVVAQICYGNVCRCNGIDAGEAYEQ